ncbi:unnamed protein product [Vitrella brassicaformis CCMP3155]|uniref:MPN domain-containing protein n=1 Tax=Vitrella brassicaformis (strain CCMP3155) TaxID=1169540 RepID=A0A0G4EF09_VITBC|nr:unnamed protein product [Vitrella brassicaformis CCMP3155]|eukprot:CEL94104.1 unnamed protein product [Vitrella brassicaformis CCMP3155]
MEPVSSSRRASSLKSFFVSPYPQISVRVHPVVVFTILDSYVRKQESQVRSVGTLLGSIVEGNVVDVTDCYTVPHTERRESVKGVQKKEIIISGEYHLQMLSFKRKISQKEQVVGWFSTGSEITELHNLPHQYYSTGNAKFQIQHPLVSPVLLLVDTALTNTTLSIKAFLNVPTPIAFENLTSFHEIPSEVYTLKSDKTALQMLIQARSNAKKRGAAASAPALHQGFEVAFTKLVKLLKACTEYVEDVLDGKIEGDTELGRDLTKMLCSEPFFDVETFDAMCQNSLQDNLMVVYLSTLSRLQVAINQKISLAQQGAQQ